MKRFRFPLRPVTVLRAHRELRARESFAAAFQKYLQAEEALQLTRARMRMLEVELSTRRKSSFSAIETAALLADYRRECAGEAETERVVATTHQEMEKSRAGYVEAHRNLEIVHRIEEKARAVHSREVLREEQAELDDFGGRRRVGPVSIAI